MKNTRNSTTLDSVVYGIVMFIANAAGAIVGILAGRYWVKSYFK